MRERSPRWPPCRPAAAPEEVAEGFVRIAVEHMANAIKKISVERGYDVTRYALQCFGGAGGQHACLVADALGMTRVLVHPLAGVLSAYGMGLADQSVIREQAVELRLAPDALPEIAAKLDALAAAAQGEVARQQARARRHHVASARACALRRHRLRRWSVTGLRRGAGALRRQRCSPPSRPPSKPPTASASAS